MAASFPPAQPAPRVMVRAGMTAAGRAEVPPSRGGVVVTAVAA